MNRIFKFAGILTCVLALGLNTQWAVDGYGIKDGKVHVEIELLGYNFLHQVLSLR